MKVIIPFFSKSELETQCILSNLSELVKSKEIKEIVLVDDNPETQIPKKIIEFKKNSKINIIKNKHNKGFIKTVNEHWNPKDKFYLIINSDIIIKKLNIKLLLQEFDKNKYLSTITIPTNSASIFSIYPHIEEPNKWFGKVNKLKWKQSNYDVVTCLGHFFLINNSSVQRKYFFDENFNLGYGEETELSLHISKTGGIHQFNMHNYCYHYGSLSFGQKKIELQKQNITKLLTLFPNYWVLVDKFIENSSFLAESSDLMINFIIDDFLSKNIDLDQINKWKKEVKKNISVEKKINYFKVTGVFGNFPLFINKFTNFSIWKNMFRELDININFLDNLS